MSTDQEDILALEQRRLRAIEDQDYDVLLDILSDDYVHIHADGRIQNRDEMIAGMRQRPRRTERGDLSLRFYGSVAVVVGRQTNLANWDGKEIVQVGEVTQVFARGETGWRLTHLQMTAVKS